MLQEHDIDECLSELPPIGGLGSKFKGQTVTQPVRLITLSSGQSLENGAAFYGIGDKTYRVEDHSGRSDKGSVLVHDLDSTAEVKSIPSKRWDQSPVEGIEVTDPAILDLLEQYIVTTTKFDARRSVIIRRGNEDYTITPRGKIHIPQAAHLVA